MPPAPPFSHITYAVEIPLLGFALGTVVLRAWSRLAVKGRLAADDGVLLFGTVCWHLPTYLAVRIFP
jgi:hypothetical protein